MTLFIDGDSLFRVVEQNAACGYNHVVPKSTLSQYGNPNLAAYQSLQQSCQKKMIIIQFQIWLNFKILI